MSLSRGCLLTLVFAGLVAASSKLCAAQVSPATDQTAAAPQAPAQQTPTIDVPVPSAHDETPAPAPAGTAMPSRKTYTVPSGTKVLLELRSAVNTKSAKPGDGVYLSSTFPVVVGNRVMIPTGVYVQGVVDRVTRGGRATRAELDMHFTSIIFPNGSVVEIPGMVDSLPGAKNQTVQDDGEGTIQQNGDKGRNAGETAKIAIPVGAGAGTLGGAASGHPLEGGLAGLAAGAATVGIVALFTRNAEVDIPRGSQVEMVLQRPLILEEANLSGIGESGAATTLVPSADQPKPVKKPVNVLCPPGSLGCQ
jgi:hypothetical protein